MNDLFVRCALAATFTCSSAIAVAAITTTVKEPADLDSETVTLDTRHAPLPSSTTPISRVTSAPSGNPLWAVPLSVLTATRERPLFSPSRRPPTPAVRSAPVVQALAAPPPPSPPERPNLVLIGTVSSALVPISAGSFAVFVDQATRAGVRLRAGEGHLGWTLQTVVNRAATLQKGRQTETLTLPVPNLPVETAPSGRAADCSLTVGCPPPVQLPSRRRSD
jgi:general secretion pathway protein N